MPTYTQADRHLTVTTPLGTDVLLLRGFSGSEGLSRLFHYELTTLAENGADVPFDSLLGAKLSAHLTLPEGQTRHFSGICSRISQATPDNDFTTYRLEVVPGLWFLTRIARSRIFQQVNIPDILKTLLTGLDVEYRLQGNYESRDFCVQYRETDFAFVSRLMEEEGIYYYFAHTADSHTLIVADTPQGHSNLPVVDTILFEPAEVGNRQADLITSWEKTQELRSGKVTLWDHCFEMPTNSFESTQPIADSVQVGGVSHKLKLDENGKLELYDAPGAFAQRFDGVTPGNGDRASDLGKITPDGTRTVALRMQEEAARGLEVRGEGHCRYLAAGYKFTLTNADEANGAYVLTGVDHLANVDGDYRSGGQDELSYGGKFTCVPAALPFRPARETPRPVVHGLQTGVVVGPAGEEIYCDKYGRVKVQFRWDREGQDDINSSCWLRVATSWAGEKWGAIQIPRIGQDVLIGFEEGDPDRPIIVGSVYNASTMPPYTLPDNKTRSTWKSRSTPGGGEANFNELRFEDKTGAEEVYFHAEKDFNRVVENNDTLKVGFDKKDSGDQTIEVYNNRTVKVGTPTSADGSQTSTIYKDRSTTLTTGNDSLDVKMGNRSVVIDMGNDSLSIKMGNQTTKLDLGASSTEALQSITLKVGQSSIVVDQMGVTIKGMMVSIEGQIQTEVKGLMTQVSGEAMLTAKGAITMIN